MPRSAVPILAQIILDPSVLAALGSPTDAAPDLLRRVERLLTDVRNRLATDTQIMIDGRKAARMCGVCERTLRDSDCPRVHIGASVRWRVEAIREWAARREIVPSERQEAAA
jgi:hypothetical protein